MLLAAAIPFVGCRTQGSADLGETIRLESGVEFDGPDGADLLSLDPRPAGVTLSDGAGATRARYRLVEGRLRIRESVGKPVGFVARAPDGGRGLRILDASGSVIFVLRSEPDGDLRLEDAEEVTVYELKSRDYGLKVVGASGELEAKVRTREGKISLRKADGKTVLGTRAAIPPVAVACLALRDLRLSYRVGLVLAILHWGEEVL